MPTRLAPRTTNPTAILAVLLLAVLTFTMSQGLIGPVLPTLRQDVDTTPTMITWVMTAFLLSASVFTPIAGRLGDRYGKDRAVIASLIALAVGSGVCAVATDVEVMILGRIIQGICGAVLPLTYGVLRDAFSPRQLPGAVSLAAAVGGVGGGVGVVLAGPLSVAFGVRSLFWIPALLAAATAALAGVVVPRSPARDSRPVSWLTTALLAAWLIALLVPLTQASRWGWSSPAVITPLVAATALACAWVAAESRSARPLVDMRMMRIPAVWTTNLVSLLFGFGLFAVTAFLPTFVQTPTAAGYGFGAGVTQAGLMLLPMSVTTLLAGLASTQLTRYLGSRTTLMGACTLYVAACVLLAFGHEHRWQIYLAVTLLGVALGAGFSTMSNVIVATVRPDQTGVANGITANFATIGGSIGIALMAAVVSAQQAADGTSAEAGYTYGFAMLAVAGLAAFAVTTAMPRRPQAANAPQAQHAAIGA
ncbi:MFS transporter [Catellatospora sp. NPDC049133]|uniref:MFS transporter n=1 Tax=Catellatospora sp. NPDC049133 TaxID=3155499 RepID=UPI0033E69F27